jgi:hypothetical protein
MSPRTEPVVILPYEGRETLAEAQKRMDKEIVLVQGIPNPRVLDAVAAEELMPQMLDASARFDMQMTAVENGVEIARSSVQTEIRNILPAAKN